MAKNITLTVFMPERRVLEKQVYRIVLPCNGKTLTIIDERAPTLLALDMGLMKILDEDNNTCEEYYVADGAVDIHDNSCTILTESVFNKNDLTLEKVQELYDEFHNPFYEWLLGIFTKEKK